jgi:E3 ubiquitin-protein ligase DOA10
MSSTDINSIIDHLANKFGVAAHALLKVLVGQQITYGIMEILWGSISLIIFIILSKLIYGVAFKRKYKESNGDHYYSSSTPENFYARFVDYTDDLFGMVITFVVLADVTALAIGIGSVSWGIMHIINPQYFAIENIFN